MKLMHVFYLIFPILICSSFLSSCNSNIPKKEIALYFQNNYFDDGPITWSEFHMYDELPDDAISQLDDIFLAADFSYLEKNLLLIADNSYLPKIENSINGYDENIYVIINQEDSIYFNKNNQFFSNNDFLFVKTKN